jgi:hypothetical protein
LPHGFLPGLEGDRGVDAIHGGLESGFQQWAFQRGSKGRCAVRGNVRAVIILVAKTLKKLHRKGFYGAFRHFGLYAASISRTSSRCDQRTGAI